MTKDEIKNYQEFFKTPSIKEFYKFTKDTQNHIISTKLVGLSSDLEFWMQMAFDNDFSKLEVLSDNYNFKVDFSFPKNYHKSDDEGKCISE